MPRLDLFAKSVSNNDRTVRIYSLSRSCLLQTLDFPARMNHASLSPDGKLLLAVGDEVPPDNDTRAFFCRKMDKLSDEVNGESPVYKHEWHEIAAPQLTQLGRDENSCFCTAFSPSGHLCAVASQTGIVTIFDIAQVQDDMDFGDAVVAVLKSSRPSIRDIWSGAVRSMCFSPAPWDLLAWAEDQGRVCVVDLRTMFQSRQTIDLDIESSGIEKFEVYDLDGTPAQRQLEIERVFLQRQREILEARDHLAAVNHTADYLEMSEERRRLEREAATSRDIFHSLSSSERRMIDSIGLRRLQSSPPQSLDNSSVAPVSVNYTPDMLADSPSWTVLHPHPPHTSQQSRSTGTASIHDFMRHRNWERSRADDRSYQPRRRSSVVISNSNLTNNHVSHQQSSSLAPIGTATPTLSASPSRLPSGNLETAVSNTFDTLDPWHTISDAMGSTAMLPDTIARLRGLQSRHHERRAQAAVPQIGPDRRMQPAQGAQERPRADHTEAMEAIVSRTRETNARSFRQTRAHRADFAHDETDREILSRRTEEPRRRRRFEEGVVTMGLGWSVDGRKL